MVKIKNIFILALLFSYAANAANWSETSISFLRGNNTSEFLAPDRPSSEITFQHASGWDHGDNFIWLDWFDYLKSSDDSTEPSLYGEWSPRFSLGKLFGFHSSKRFIADILQSNTLEFGRSISGRARGHLYGIGIDFNMPGFEFFQYNLYVRDNPDIQGRTWQSTFTYRSRFNLSEKLQLTWAAYVDIVHGTEGNVQSHWHTGQQLLVDIGKLFNKKNNVFYMGLEFQYWSTKFGITQIGKEENLKYMMTWII